MNRLSYGLPYLVLGMLCVLVLGFTWHWTFYMRDDRTDETSIAEEESTDVSMEDKKRQQLDQLLKEREGPLT